MEIAVGTNYATSLMLSVVEIFNIQHSTPIQFLNIQRSILLMIILLIIE